MALPKYLGTQARNNLKKILEFAHGPLQRYQLHHYPKRTLSFVSHLVTHRKVYPAYGPWHYRSDSHVLISSIFNQWNQADQRFPFVLLQTKHILTLRPPHFKLSCLVCSPYCLYTTIPTSSFIVSVVLFLFEFLVRSSINPCWMNFQWYSLLRT